MMRSHFLGSLIEIVLGRHLVIQAEKVGDSLVPHGTHGATLVIKNCKICSE